MNLKAYRIEINRHEPFIGLFESSRAAFDAFHDLAASEAETLNGFRLAVRPLKGGRPLTLTQDAEQIGSMT